MAGLPGGGLSRRAGSVVAALELLQVVLALEVVERVAAEHRPPGPAEAEPVEGEEHGDHDHDPLLLERGPDGLAVGLGAPHAETLLRLVDELHHHEEPESCGRGEPREVHREERLEGDLPEEDAPGCLVEALLRPRVVCEGHEALHLLAGQFAKVDWRHGTRHSLARRRTKGCSEQRYCRLPTGLNSVFQVHQEAVTKDHHTIK